MSEGKKGEKMRRREGKMKMRGWKGGRKRETEKEKHKSKDKQMYVEEIYISSGIAIAGKELQEKQLKK